MEKAFLFDTMSKVYIATDSSPLDNQTYIICSDYIDLVGDFSLLYESVLPPSTLINPNITRRPGTMNGSTPHPRSASVGSRATTLSALSKVDVPSPTISSPPEDDDLESKRLPSSRVKLGTGATIAQWTINQSVNSFRSSMI